MGSRVELFEEIRRDRRVEALSIRELAERHKVHRRAVRQALASPLPPPRKEYLARYRPAIDPWTTVIDAWLIADQGEHRKQRHTARRVWQRLVAEHQDSRHGVKIREWSGRVLTSQRRARAGARVAGLVVDQCSHTLLSSGYGPPGGVERS